MLFADVSQVAPFFNAQQEAASRAVNADNAMRMGYWRGMQDQENLSGQAANALGMNDQNNMWRSLDLARAAEERDWQRKAYANERRMDAVKQAIDTINALTKEKAYDEKDKKSYFNNAINMIGDGKLNNLQSIDMYANTTGLSEPMRDTLMDFGASKQESDLAKHHALFGQDAESLTTKWRDRLKGFPEWSVINDPNVDEAKKAPLRIGMQDRLNLFSAQELTDPAKRRYIRPDWQNLDRFTVTAPDVPTDLIEWRKARRAGVPYVAGASAAPTPTGNQLTWDKVPVNKRVRMSDGSYWIKNPDGSPTQVQ